MPLTLLQERFVEAYSADPRSASKAYVTAGGTEGPGAKVSACRLLQHPAVSEGIQRRQKRFHLEQERIRDELFAELKLVVHSPEASVAEKLKAAELLCKMFGLL